MINIVKYAGTEKGFICDGKHLIIIPSWKSLYVYFSSIFSLLSDDQVVSGLPRGVVWREIRDRLKTSKISTLFFSDSTHSRAAWAGNSTLKIDFPLVAQFHRSKAFHKNPLRCFLYFISTHPTWVVVGAQSE